MTEQLTTAAIARAFTEAWTSRDLDTARGYLGEDVVFDGPLGHVEGREKYLESLDGLARGLALTGVRVLAAFGDENQALIMYELLTGPFGALLCAKLLTFRDGKIVSDQLTFDSYAMRKAQGG